MKYRIIRISTVLYLVLCVWLARLFTQDPKYRDIDKKLSCEILLHKEAAEVISTKYKSTEINFNIERTFILKKTDGEVISRRVDPVTFHTNKVGDEVCFQYEDTHYIELLFTSLFIIAMILGFLSIKDLI